MANIWLNSNKKTASVLAVAVFLFVLDRYLKSLAFANFSYNIIGEWLKFSFMQNYGIAFSLPLGGILLNFLIGGIILGLLVWAGKSHKEAKMSQFYAILGIATGAASNLFDRLAYGYVVDYLDLRYFTIFNLADAIIICGVVWLIWLGVDKKQ
jgi:signal peptidase II